MKTTDPIYIEIANWFNSVRDFNQGIALLLKYGHKKSMARNMQGRPHRYHKKLEYELSKLIGVEYRKIASFEVKGVTGNRPDSANPEELPETTSEGSADLMEDHGQNGEPQPEDHADPSMQPTTESGTQAVENPSPEQVSKNPEPSELTDSELENLPKVIRRIIYECHDLYRKRTLAHEDLKKITDNSETSIQKRVEISELIAKLSARMDFLQAARKEFVDSGTLPDEKTLWRDSVQPIPMNRQELVEKKKNLQKSLSKDQSLLEFQSKKNGEASQPMPPGPKREKIEARIRQKESEIEQLQKAIDDIDKTK